MKTTALLGLALALLIGWPAHAAEMPRAARVLEHTGVSSGLAVVVGTTDAKMEKPVREVAEDIDSPATHTGGGHWCFATDDRVVTSGLLLFSTAPRFEQFGKPWRLPYAIGHCCPIQPAVADGRLFMHLDNTAWSVTTCASRQAGTGSPVGLGIVMNDTGPGPAASWGLGARKPGRRGRVSLRGCPVPSMAASVLASGASVPAEICEPL